MKYQWIEAYCMAKKGVIKDYQNEWEAFRYFVGGKMFVMQGSDKAGNAIITLKCDPIDAEMLRAKYEAIIPGYYMNKKHWNSIDLNGNISDELMKKMIDVSYELIFEKLTKKKQAEIQSGI